MKIKVTLPKTIFGEIVKTFANYSDAMDWIEVCIQNDLKVIIEKI